jgi:hypothetical protein
MHLDQVSFVCYDLSIVSFLESNESFRQFISGFEQGTLPLTSWNHTAHVAMAAWYLQTLPESDVVERVRQNIRHYNECAGVPNTPDRGYHETLTIFWLNTIREFLAAEPAPEEPLDGVRRTVAEFGSRRDLFRKYYSFDVIASRAARANWIPPDIC